MCLFGTQMSSRLSPVTFRAISSAEASGFFGHGRQAADIVQRVNKRS
jgi:hypothetical protein